MITDSPKHALGLWEGATENAAACQSLLASLQSPGTAYRPQPAGEPRWRLGRCAPSSGRPHSSSDARSTSSATSWTSSRSGGARGGRRSSGATPAITRDDECGREPASRARSAATRRGVSLGSFRRRKPRMPIIGMRLIRSIRGDVPAAVGVFHSVQSPPRVTGKVMLTKGLSGNYCVIAAPRGGADGAVPVAVKPMTVQPHACHGPQRQGAGTAAGDGQRDVGGARAAGPRPTRRCRGAARACYQPDSSRHMRTSGPRRRPFAREASRRPSPCCSSATRRSEGPAMLDGEELRHDLRNQLAVICGFSEILVAQAPPGDPRRPDLEEIHKAAVIALDLLLRAYPSQEGPGR